MEPALIQNKTLGQLFKMSEEMNGRKNAIHLFKDKTEIIPIPEEFFPPAPCRSPSG
jgi:hypothetical protein